MGGSDGQGQAEVYALSVERVIDAEPEAIFDAFIALYDSQRPDWVTGSQLDLRPGGRWSVAFQVPDGPAFREERVITAVERPGRLAYDMRAIYPGAPGCGGGHDRPCARRASYPPGAAGLPGRGGA